MAGSGHDSVTGLDDRTVGRIDLILFDADYRDAQAAVEDAVSYTHLTLPTKA